MDIPMVAAADFQIDKTDLVLSLFSGCSAKLKARTSGVLLVAGVGSYFTYRLLGRLLGRSFVWTLIDTARLPHLSTADRRLLHPARQEDEYASIYADNELSESEADAGDAESLPEETPRTPHSTPRRRALAVRNARARGPLALRRDDSHGEQADTGVPVIRSRRSSAASSRRTDCSASLRIVFDANPAWDDEFAEGVIQRATLIAGTSSQGQRVSVEPPEHRPEPSLLDMCSVFDDILTVASEESRMRVEEDVDVEDEEENEASAILKCMRDSKHLYQSVVVARSDFNGSDLQSLCSGRSGRSSALGLRALRNRLQHSPQNPGLWELSEAERPSTSGFQSLQTSSITTTPQIMTDSGISRSTKRSGDKRSSMFDSAIGTDFLSSDEEVETRLLVPQRAASVVRRCHLEHINESEQMSVAGTEMSLEWFEEGLDAGPLEQEGQSDEPDDGGRYAVGTLDLDFDQLDPECASNGNLPTRSSIPSDEMETPKVQRQHQTQRSEPVTTPRPGQSLPPGTRDLMVLARERWSPTSPFFKLLHHLYGGRRRLRRVLVPGEDEELAAVLATLHYHGVDVLGKAADVEAVLAKRFDEVNLFHDWPLPEDDAGSRASPLLHLLDALAALRKGEHSSLAADGLRVLLVLQCIDATTGSNAGDRSSTEMNEDANPRELLEQLRTPGFVASKTFWERLAALVPVRAEVLDANSAVATVTSPTVERAPDTPTGGASPVVYYPSRTAAGATVTFVRLAVGGSSQERLCPLLPQPETADADE